MKKITFFIFIALLVSCSATEEFYDDITAPDYVSSSKAKRLEVPPDLSEMSKVIIIRYPVRRNLTRIIWIGKKIFLLQKMKKLQKK